MSWRRASSSSWIRRSYCLRLNISAIDLLPGRYLTTDPNDQYWKFGSRHTGVVQFCFADGHVRAVPVTLNPLVLEMLSMIQDGHVVPDF